MSLGQPGVTLPSMRVLANIRLSNDTDETTSPARQRAGLKSWADALGHEIVGWAEDLDVSGNLPPWKRPSLGPWLTDSPPVEFEIIASTKIDRLSRSLGDFVDLIDWTSGRGKYLVAYMDSVDTSTPTGELVAKVLAIFAEFERKQIAGRTRDSYILALQEGRWHGGSVPYGYFPEKQPKGEGWKLVPDPESAGYFQGIVQRFLAGISLTQLAYELNVREILPPTDYYRSKTGKELAGAKWSGTSLRLILASRAPLGVVERDGEVLRGVDGLPVRRAEPIISRKEWDQVQTRLAEISKVRPRTAKTAPLLQIAFCIDCGHPLYRLRNVKKTKSGEKINEYYRCRGWRDKLNDCQNSSLKSEKLTLALEEAFLTAIGDREVFEEVYIPASDHTQALEEAYSAHGDLLKATAGKSEAVKKSYQAQIATLEALIERLDALPQSAARTELRPTGCTYRQIWDASDEDERRALLLKAGVRIEAGPQDGPWVSVGRFERPERYDQAVSLGVFESIRYAFYLPVDLVDRVATL